MKLVCVIMLFLFCVVNAYAVGGYDIVDVFRIVRPKSGTMAVGKYNKIMEVERFLVPSELDIGRHVVKVQRVGDNFYQIKDSEICIETRFCNEWVSFGEKVIIIINSKDNHIKGKIIFN